MLRLQGKKNSSCPRLRCLCARSCEKGHYARVCHLREGASLRTRKAGTFGLLAEKYLRIYAGTMNPSVSESDGRYPITAKN